MIKIITSKKIAARKFFSLCFRRNLLTLLGTLVFALSTIQAAQANTYTVSNLSDSGAGSLRDAITSANANPGADRIEINAGVGTINLATPLPAITDTVAIINLGTGSGRVELNGLATQNGSTPSIGFDIQAPNCEIWGFAINRFGDAGIRVGVGGDGTIIHQNYIGTDINGATLNCPDAAHPCGNINRGVWVYGANNVQIGVGTFNGHSNTISGNFGRGIVVSGVLVNGNLIGSAIIKNNYIGGVSSPGDPNTDIGNTQDGILIAGASACQIGGTDNLDRNYILGNGGNGISIIADVNFPASNNVIKGNNIGYTLGSNRAVGNDGSGIVIQGANNAIGGTTAAERNVIVGNKVNGVSINSSLASGNVVQGNYIGTGDGSSALGNNNNGIQISNNAVGNIIGGTSVTAGQCDNSCNVIANNGTTSPTPTTANAGVYVDNTAGTGNSIRSNSIHDNVGLGIDLGTVGTTANDAQDTDTGPNDLQNFPVINSAITSGAVDGVLNSTPSSTFAIDFYENTSTDGNSSEGRIYIGSANVTTDTSGNASFTFNVPSGITLSAGQFITATATSISGSVQAVGDTSEFSAAQAVTTTTQPLGYEGDVTPRSTGDGVIDATDSQQIERFSVGFDKPYQLNEGQRADCAPRSTGGDGVVDATDVQQAERYSIGLDPKTPASGTVMVTAPQQGSASQSNSKGITNLTKNALGLKESPAAPRTLSVQNVSTSRGQDVVVNILDDAAGDEAGYTFSISYDSTQLTNPRIATGGIAGETVLPNATTAGQIGFSVRFGGGTIPAGNGQVLLKITFTVDANANFGTTPINFTSTPAVQRTSDTNAQPLATNYVNGNVTVSQPTAAGAAITGRVKGERGQALAGVTVVLLDVANGKTVETKTSGRGVYRFENTNTGDNYIITPRIFGYVFNPTSKFVSLVGDIADADFTAVRSKKGLKGLRKL